MLGQRKTTKSLLIIKLERGYCNVFLTALSFKGVKGVIGS